MAASVTFDTSFRIAFKEVSRKNMQSTIDRLLNLFDTPENHFCRATMHRFYFKYPTMYFDKEIASKILMTLFEGAYFSILDITDKATFNHRVSYSFVTDSSSMQEQAMLNWNAFVKELQRKYLEILPKEDEPNFFEDRPPKNLREKILNSEIQIEVDGKTIIRKYSFFNVKEVLKYYEVLLALYYPEYPMVKEASSKKIKRYGRDVGNGMYLGFFVDFSFIEKELRNNYLEFPKIKIEVFSRGLTSPIIESAYLKGQTDGAIARVNPFYFMGNFISYRIGDSSEGTSDIQQKLHFYFRVNSFYTKIYLDEVANILAVCRCF